MYLLRFLFATTLVLPSIIAAPVPCTQSETCALQQRSDPSQASTIIHEAAHYLAGQNGGVKQGGQTKRIRTRDLVEEIEARDFDELEARDVEELERRGKFGTLFKIGKAIFKGAHHSHNNNNNQNQKRSEEIELDARDVEELDRRGKFGALFKVGKAIFKGAHHHHHHSDNNNNNQNQKRSEELERRGKFGALFKVGKAIFKGVHHSHNNNNNNQKRSPVRD